MRIETGNPVSVDGDEGCKVGKWRTWTVFVVLGAKAPTSRAKRKSKHVHVTVIDSLHNPPSYGGTWACVSVRSGSSHVQGPADF